MTTAAVAGPVQAYGTSNCVNFVCKTTERVAGFKRARCINKRHRVVVHVSLGSGNICKLIVLRA